MKEHKRRKPFAVIITIVSVPFILLSILSGMHGGIDLFPISMFIASPWLTWSLVLTNIKNLIYYLTPMIMMALGLLFLFDVIRF